ncbi:MAG: exodeoxyribonuclease VII large subunit [Bacteroidetes bacterium]|nr:exodeoxyribonuclease VII large subunit [Bacteroidota bacterium]
MRGPSTETAIPVGKYLATLREYIETSGAAWVEGELSQHKSSRGHWYFTIADESSALKCVMWKSRTQYVGFTPEPGQLLRVYGSPTVYPKYGNLQFDVRRVERRHTTGELQKRFLELHRKLAQDGLFDESKKVPLPAIPQRIGVVTSGEGAALQDILRILRDRFPIAEVILAPVRVQGPSAAPDITHAIEQLNRLTATRRPDVLIVGRGGGSLEDLWAFNEETVARAIFASKIPVISAVGHETDTTIADFVADVRAATPTHAAQTIVPELSSLVWNIQGYTQQMHQTVISRISRLRQQIIQVTESYTFNTPINRVRDAQQTLTNYVDLLNEVLNSRIQTSRHQVELLNGKITALNPRRYLTRGYVRLERGGKVVRFSRELDTRDRVSIHFVDGCREAVISD